MSDQTLRLKRLIYTDLENIGISNFKPGVYAIVGPFDSHTSEMLLQDALTELVKLHNDFVILDVGSDKLREKQ